MSHQDRKLGVVEHVLGHAAEHHLPQAAVRVGPDDQEVGRHGVGFQEKDVPHPARALLDMAGLGVALRLLDRVRTLEEEIARLRALLPRT